MDLSPPPAPIRTEPAPGIPTAVAPIDVHEVAGRLTGAIDSVVAGKHEVAEIAVATVLSGATS